MHFTHLMMKRPEANGENTTTMTLARHITVIDGVDVIEKRSVMERGTKDANEQGERHGYTTHP